MNARLEQRRAAAALATKASAAKTLAARADIIEEIEFMHGCGESPSRIAERFGYDKPESLERRMIRAGRLDLAAMFRPAYKHQERTKFPCRAGCGGTCSRGSKLRICRTCCDRYGVGWVMRETHDVEAVLARIPGRAA